MKTVILVGDTYEVGGEVVSCGYSWAMIEAIDEEEKMLICSDADGGECEIPFQSVLSYYKP
jgi:hypothetical protein